MKYCADLFNYNRRKANTVAIGNVPMGADYPIRIQSMTNTSTLDTSSSVQQCIELIHAGAEYIRLTTQGVREAENLQEIKSQLRSKGYTTPLVADVHFNPKVAEVAASIVEKVRINPGNYVDSIKTFEQFEYSDQEYALEVKKIEEKFIPLIDLCKSNNTALRIGVNHGSLSDRIMSRYGDTAQGMVESCMEFLRICVKENFFNVVISIKASNTKVMVHTVRLLVETMNTEDMYFPLHLGVTEAGDAEDGRIKSAVGIGTLLADGIGDTIRVSLSEHPTAEIPVAQTIVNYFGRLSNAPRIKSNFAEDFFSPFTYKRRESNKLPINIGSDYTPIVIQDASGGGMIKSDGLVADYIYLGKRPIADVTIPIIIDAEVWEKQPNTFPLFNPSTMHHFNTLSCNVAFFRLSLNEIDNKIVDFLRENRNIVVLLNLQHQNVVGEGRSFFAFMREHKLSHSVIISKNFAQNNPEILQIEASIEVGSFFLDGFGDGIMISNHSSALDMVSLSFHILQATRSRMSKTEFISCPGCGRTLFNLQTTIANIKQATSHLKHLKIGIMGCIVNGPGEMADADYGYVGAGKGKISLYKKQNCIKKNIPEDDAVNQLIELIKDNGDWYDPAV